MERVYTMNATPVKKGPKPSIATAFLAHREAIAAELEKGWTMSVVHKQYAERLEDVSYVQFTRYVHRFVGRKEKPDATDAAASSAPVRKKAAVQTNDAPRPERRSGPIVTQARETKRFIFDPTAAHRRKDELF
jgi:hypothetical protein